MIGPKTGYIQYRDGQDAHTNVSDNGVKIFAPEWVEKALEKILPEFQGAQFHVEVKQEKL